MAIDVQEAEKLQAAKGSHLPIHICCVLDEHSDFNCPVLHAIRDHCSKNSVLFTTRIYDSSKYNCDRDYIERLPALHIFMRRLYIKTYYPNTRPIQHIDDAIEVYTKQLEYKKKIKHIWAKRLASFIKWCRSLTHRKTRMEQYNEEHVTRVRPTADWASRIVMTPE